VGLPPELEAARATDRCTSFCQFVVAGNQPLEIEDASREPGLPEDLIQRYGIRAYVGFPLRVAGQAVGSFCVLDVKTRTLDASARARLEQLARAASARLEALAAQWGPATGGEATEAETRAHEAWLAVAESQSLLSLSGRFASGQLSFEEFQRALGALATLSGSLTPREPDSADGKGP
jgi:GAF domain-containing protein